MWEQCMYDTNQEVWWQCGAIFWLVAKWHLTICEERKPKIFQFNFVLRGRTSILLHSSNTCSVSDSVIHDAQFRMSCHQDSGIAGTTLTGDRGDSVTAEDHCVCGKTVACIGSQTLSVKQVGDVTMQDTVTSLWRQPVVIYLYIV